MSMKERLLYLKDTFIRFQKEQDTIEKKLFWSVVPLIMLAGFFSVIFTLIEGLSTLAFLSGVFCVIGPGCLILRCYKRGNCERYYVFFCFMFNCLLMPATFLANGGLDSGMPMYCFGSVLLCAFCIDKGKRFWCFAICMCVYIIVFFTAHFFPDLVIPIKKEMIWFDIILDFVLSVICVWIVIGSAIEEYNSQRYNDVNNGLIDSLGAIIEFRSLETGNHVRNIKECTRIMLEYANKIMDGVYFTKEDIVMISSASVLHDIGKIAVPDNVLQKPGRLTAEEYEVIKKHPEDGCKMIETLKDYQNPIYYEYCYEICRHHHERYNGTGYPDGLKGEEIPLVSQIVALADVYEALTSKRVYKEAYDMDRAKDIILNQSQGQFSARVLECFQMALPELEACIMNCKPLPRMKFSVGRSIKVGICLQDSKELQQVNTMVLNYLEDRGIRSAVEIYPHPDSILEACRETAVDILILSVENAAMSGVDIAKEAVQYNSRTKVIYVADDDANVLQACGCNVVGYHIRPLTRESMEESLNKAFMQNGEGSDQTVVFRTKSKLYVMRSDDVVVTATDNHMQNVFTTSDEVVRIKKTGKEMFEMLEPYGCFVRCGASYTVNLSHIEEISTNLLIMSNHMTIPIPRRVYPELVKQYKEYYRYQENY